MEIRRKIRIIQTTYSGYADGVIGTASGSVSGNAFNWKYGFKLKSRK